MKRGRGGAKKEASSSQYKGVRHIWAVKSAKLSRIDVQFFYIGCPTNGSLYEKEEAESFLWEKFDGKFVLIVSACQSWAVKLILSLAPYSTHESSQNWAQKFRVIKSQPVIESLSNQSSFHISTLHLGSRQVSLSRYDAADV